MLESALHYGKVLSHLEVIEGNFVHCARSDEWARIEKLCGFLKVFYEVAWHFLGPNILPPTSTFLML